MKAKGNTNGNKNGPKKTWNDRMKQIGPVREVRQQKKWEPYEKKSDKTEEVDKRYSLP